MAEGSVTIPITRREDYRVNPKYPPGPPMTLGNMHEQGVQHLIAFCLNDACSHQALIECRSIRL